MMGLNSMENYFDKVVIRRSDVEEVKASPREPLKLPTTIIEKYDVPTCLILYFIICGVLYNQRRENIKMYADDIYWVQHSLNNLNRLSFNQYSKSTISRIIQQCIDDGLLICKYGVDNSHTKQRWYSITDKTLDLISPDLDWILKDIDKIIDNIK